MGASVAYHLTQLGWRDVVLLEQGSLSGGTTWHAAGLIGQLRSSSNFTRLIRYSAELYSRLEAETGQATGWKRCGSVSVARTAERMIQLKRNAAMANAYGVEAHVIGLDEAAARYPLMRTDDLVGAVWIPGDGKANPADITAGPGARGPRGRGPADGGRQGHRRQRRERQRSPGSRPRRGPSRPRSWSTARACGRASSGA